MCILLAWKSNSVGEYDGGLSSENIVYGKLVIEGNRIHRRRVKSKYQYLSILHMVFYLIDTGMTYF